MEELEGIVEEIIFRNDDNGWGVVSLARGQGRTDRGRHAPLHQTGGACTRLGTYINHPTFGRRDEGI